MKADLTRDTFHPAKHYARVVMQQGRVQLDADWNEQASILLRYLQALATDLIGPAGGPQDNYGFEVVPIDGSNPRDFQIGFGRYYVGGLLCEADYIPIAISLATPPNVFVVRNWNSDFEQTTVPYYEVFDDTPASAKAPVRVQISNPEPLDKTITISGDDFSTFKKFRFSEARWLEFRAEFFNLLNTPQFNNPNGTVGSPAFGRITSAGSPISFQRTSRQIQFGLKLYF